MHFEFASELSDTDLWNIYLLDAHLDSLDTDIPSKYIVCLHNVFKRSSRHVFKTSSRHVFKTSSRHVFKTSSRHVLQDVFKICLQDIFKTCLEDVFNVTICRLPRRQYMCGHNLRMKFPPNFQNYTGLKGLVNSFS